VSIELSFLGSFILSIAYFNVLFSFYSLITCRFKALRSSCSDLFNSVSNIVIPNKDFGVSQAIENDFNLYLGSIIKLFDYSLS